MSAQAASVFTIVCPAPDYNSLTNQQNCQRVNSQISYTYPIPSNVRTLSPDADGDDTDLTGLLYVPDLQTDECRNASLPWMPVNATHQADLPNNDFSLIALAPWVSPTCTLEYLAGTQGLATQAIVFYLPGNSTGMPPLPNDPVWNLGDGGQWKKQYRFGAYAIPGLSGSMIANQMVLYRGNLSTVPNAGQLAQAFHPSDYVRLWMDISIAGHNGLPSLWVFLLIVLGLLIFVIGTTSLAMHMIQRKRRTMLRRRVINGEVDLEALGIKRLTVPQEILDKMPVTTYSAAHIPPLPTEPEFAHTKEITSSSPSSPIAAVAATSVPRTSKDGSVVSPSVAQHSQAYSQPTCPICLDDFEAGETLVRELPCHHIFHPDCVDTFLLNNSSLCPMCKVSTLPKGYCPANITNAMVRRERNIRRLRDRVPRRQSMASHPNANSRRTFPVPVVGRIFSGGPRRVFAGQGRSNIEMRDTRASELPLHNNQRQSPLTSPVDTTSPAAPVSDANAAPQSPCDPPVPPVTGQTRREWARQRALAMIGRRGTEAEVDPVEREEATRPRWRKAVGRVFPGLA